MTDSSWNTLYFKMFTILRILTYSQQQTIGTSVNNTSRMVFQVEKLFLLKKRKLNFCINVGLQIVRTPCKVKEKFNLKWTYIHDFNYMMLRRYKSHSKSIETSYIPEHQGRVQNYCKNSSLISRRNTKQHIVPLLTHGKKIWRCEHSL